MDNIEDEIKQMSNGRCAICHNPGKSIYKLNPNNGNEIDNLILLCTNCACEYIGNLDLVNQLKQRRNFWYEQVKNAIEKTGNTDVLILNQHEEVDNSVGIAIYHAVYEEEGFYDAAKDLFELLKSSQEKMPNKKKISILRHRWTYECKW